MSRTVFRNPPRERQYKKKFASDFGFTSEELLQLVQKNHINIKLDDIKYWYNGYKNALGEEIYNPWSIVGFIKSKGLLKPYWYNTGDIL